MAISALPTARLRPYSEYELLGVSIEFRPARVVAVRLRVSGYGLESRLELIAGTQLELPVEIVDLIKQLQADALSRSEWSLLASSLTSSVISLSQELLTDGGGGLPLGIGVSEPNFWHTADGDAHGFTTLCDAALLAEASGLSVIDAFPARDLAMGGRGMPLDALPLWLLLHDARRARLVVHTAEATRLTYLPASCEASGAARVATFELNIQQPLAPCNEDSAWSPLAEDILQLVADRVPRRPPLGQLVFAETTDDTQPLRNALAIRLADVEQSTVDELGIPAPWLGAACAAGLAMLHVEQIPSGGTLQTGSSAARVLGRLTPGTPNQWRRLLKLLADHQPSTMSLRSAM